MTVSLGNGVDIGNIVTADVNPLTGGIEIPAIGLSVLMPTGLDQSVQIAAHIAAAAATGIAAEFGPGDFIVNGSVPLVSKRKDPAEGYGYGLNMRGAGPEVTRFIDVRADKSLPLFYVTEPVGKDVGNRAIMAKFSDFSVLAANQSGTPFSLTDTPDGVAFMAKASSGTGFGAFVLHSSRMERVRFHGHAHAFMLDDTTQFVFEDVRFTKHLSAVKLGTNCDILRFKNCGWGSEISNSDASWMAMTAIETLWDSGVITPVGGENIVTIEGAWVMRIGCFYKNKGSGGSNLKISDSYFEGVKRYFYADHSLTLSEDVTFDNCHFSLMDVNGPTTSDPDNVNYSAYFQFGSTGINRGVSAGPNPYLTLRNCLGSGVHLNAPISFVGRGGYIDWINTRLQKASDGFGHMRCIRTGYESYREVKTSAANIPPSIKFGGGGDAGGMGRVSGEPVPVTASVAAAATHSINIMNGDSITLNLPDGDCTVDSLAYSATPPSNLVHRGAEVEIYLVAPASVTANRTISFGPRLLGISPLTMLTTDANKVAMIKLKAQSGNGQRFTLDGPAPTFGAAT